ncbi:MAG: hypothetical protein MJ228_04095 [Bacilli bacterium]|nr:hypothetical protein [Bacilli bacterium]
MAEKKQKKLFTKIVDIVLGLLIVGVIGLQVDMMLTKKDNYNVPSLFGYSFMEVLTDSMEGTNSDSFDAGEGVIIQKKKEVKPDDVITFFSVDIKCCVSHRVKEIVYSPASPAEKGKFIVSSSLEYSFDRVTWIKGGEEVERSHEEGGFYAREISSTDKKEPEVWHDIPAYSENQKITYYTCGDNLSANWYIEATGHAVASSYRDTVDSKYYVGTIVSHNKALGVALNVFQSGWFIPTAVMVPILIIAIMSVIDFVKTARQEQKEEDERIRQEMIAAGVDPNDERAVFIFTEKAKYRIDMEKELEALKKEQKEIYMKELSKAKEELLKDPEFLALLASKKEGE